MEEIFYSETLVDIQRTTRRYVPEDRTLHNHRSENLISYKALLFIALTFPTHFLSIGSSRVLQKYCKTNMVHFEEAKQGLSAVLRSF
jgi:hypothetical protein